MSRCDFSHDPLPTRIYFPKKLYDEWVRHTEEPVKVGDKLITNGPFPCEYLGGTIYVPGMGEVEVTSGPVCRLFWGTNKIIDTDDGLYEEVNGKIKKIRRKPQVNTNELNCSKPTLWLIVISNSEADLSSLGFEKEEISDKERGIRGIIDGLSSEQAAKASWYKGYESDYQANSEQIDNILADSDLCFGQNFESLMPVEYQRRGGIFLKEYPNHLSYRIASPDPHSYVTDRYSQRSYQAPIPVERGIFRSGSIVLC